MPNASLLSSKASEAAMVTPLTFIPVMHWNKNHSWVDRQMEVVNLVDSIY
jgi:hypothetical protein